MFVTLRVQIANCCLILFVACGTPSFAQAPQDDAASAAVAPHEAYARGARAYFAGRSGEAEQLLTAAIEYNPNDPSARYLRGLNYLHQRDTRKAQADLAEGARLEAEQSRSASPLVDRAVSGVQGADRVMLERIRREARRAARMTEARSVASAYKQARLESESRVLRTAYKLPLESLVSRLTPNQAQEVATKVSPAEMGSMVAGSGDTPASDGEAATGADSDNPFADDPNPFAEEVYEGGDVASAAADNASTAAGATTNSDADIPAEARGTLSTSGLFGLFGNPVKRTVGSVAGKANEMAQQAMGGGGPPPAGAGDFGPGEFGPGEFDGAEFDGAEFESGDDNPFEFDGNAERESDGGAGADDAEEDLF